MTGLDDVAMTPPPQARLRFLPARLRGWLTSDSDHRVAQRIAGTAFLIRVLSAGMLYASQVFLARWMGSYEFGIYIYVTTWLIFAGELVPLGLSTLAQRFVPEYRAQATGDLLRGFVLGSRWLVFTMATLTALAAAGLILLFRDRVQEVYVVPLLLLCLALPFHGLTALLDGIAGSFGWIRLALVPPYLVKPILIFLLIAAAHLAGIEANAVNAMLAAVAATWTTTMVQLLLLDRHLPQVVPPGPRAYAARYWLHTAFPVFLMRGFYTALACTDVLMLQRYMPPDAIAHYYAAAKVIAIVSLVVFAVGRGVDYKFAEYHAAGNRPALEDFVAHSVRLTFWASLAATAGVLAIGWPFLWLYGPQFTHAYPLMFILGAGLLARASVGSAERLLTTLGHQRICAICYAGSFAVCLGGCWLLIPLYGTYGAAVATCLAMMFESAALVIAARSRLGITPFILAR